MKSIGMNCDSLSGLGGSELNHLLAVFLCQPRTSFIIPYPIPFIYSCLYCSINHTPSSIIDIVFAYQNVLIQLIQQATHHSSATPQRAVHQHHVPSTLNLHPAIPLTPLSPHLLTSAAMPPRKAAAAKSKDKDTDDDASALIVEYLRAQNRPYSATDVSSNLHNKVTKTKTDKLLKEMFERGEIGGRASGKQWVFWAVQVRLFMFMFLFLFLFLGLWFLGFGLRDLSDDLMERRRKDGEG
jgi:hypothetical protein